MTYINWDKSYSVGIKTLDNQHKHLFDIINKLYDVCESNKSMEVIGDVFDQVLEYTMAHFSLEEQYMLHYDYEDFDEHKALHDKLTSRAFEVSEKIHAGDKEAVVQAHAFLRDWLEKHIKKVDSMYAEHIRDVRSEREKIA